MIIETNNTPINISLDTQILFDFLIDNYYESEIVRLNHIVETENNKDIVKEAKKTLHYSLRIYPLISFLHYLLENNKIHLNITPTSYSEIYNADITTNITIDILQEHSDKLDQIISNIELNKIIQNYVTSKNFTNVNNFLTWRKKAIATATDFEYIPEDKLIQNIQTDIINLAKKKLFQNSFFKIQDFVSFQFMPLKVDGKKNTLREEIYKLSEKYRLDRKRIKIDPITKNIINNTIPKKEINDSVIMATCALTHLPLITEDKQALTGKLDIYKEENKRFNKDKSSDRKAIGEPYTTEDFIVNFFKDDFENFLTQFKIPKHITQIDKKRKIADEISKVLKSPSKTLFTKTQPTNTKDICKMNRERFFNAFSSLKDNNIRYLSLDEFFDPDSPHIANETAEAVTRFRQLDMPTTAIVAYESMKLQIEQLKQLKQDFWGIKEMNDGKIISLKKQAAPIVLAIRARKIWYNILVVINNLIQKLYGKDINTLPRDIIDLFNSISIQISYDSYNNTITGFHFKGLDFEPNTPNDLENAKLSIKYNANQLQEETILLLGSNPFTLKHSTIAKKLDKYTQEFYHIHQKKLECDRYTSINFENLQKSEPNKFNSEIMEHDQQIHAMIGSFRPIREFLQ